MTQPNNNEWLYDTAPDLEQSLVERLRNFPREPDILVYLLRSCAALALRAWLKLYHRFQIEGAENLPESGSFVLVANHTSHLDAFCLISALPFRKLHRTFPAAAQDYFFVSISRLAFAAVLVNALPFSRRLHIRQSLKLCRQLLASPGNILILFPEGTRSTTGRMQTFKPGIGTLVSASDIPVLPCYISGAFAAWPKGALLPRPAAVRLQIGKPRNYSHLSRGKDSAVLISKDLEQAVKELSQ